MAAVIGVPKDLFVFTKLHQAVHRLYSRVGGAMPVRYHDKDPEANGLNLDLHSVVVSTRRPRLQHWPSNHQLLLT